MISSFPVGPSIYVSLSPLNFLFEEAAYKEKFFVPARVIAGLGAICFTLFSIVSILESGTKKP